LYAREKSIFRKHLLLTIEKFPSLVLSRSGITLYTFYEMLEYERLKAKANFELLALNVVAVIYNRFPM